MARLFEAAAEPNPQHERDAVGEEAATASAGQPEGVDRDSGDARQRADHGRFAGRLAIYLDGDEASPPGETRKPAESRAARRRQLASVAAKCDAGVDRHRKAVVRVPHLSSCAASQRATSDRRQSRHRLRGSVNRGWKSPGPRAPAVNSRTLSRVRPAGRAMSDPSTISVN